ncbi:MAG: hypothetical protein DI551_01920 [Micavibrio aeruginosavorus]|uniref:Uncharacterized protein n=1 Tax=Micavibrio aeruginosavorus TaxID=349221 RepID=A0A2W5N7F1_9BACT|nr:MAG: hypothetical protein DI551_01920 [Micavibrio aeruginosavorus]
MLFIGNRQEEILSRARNRSVTAVFHLSAPGVDEGASPEQFGLLYQDGKPLRSLQFQEIFSQTAHMYKIDDTCEPLVDRDPKVLAQILDAVARRTQALATGELSQFHGDRKRLAFNCDDLVAKATGIPARLKLDFKKSSEVFEGDLARLPFPKLKRTLESVYDKVRTIGGTLHSADIAHTASMSAHDYYEISLQRQFTGYKHTYGDQMLARATSLLQRMGVPYVEPRKPSGLH